MKLSDTALTKLKQLRENDKQMLRVAVVGGGCSGMSYRLSWEEAHRSDDLASTIDDLTILIDPKSYLFIKNLEIDFNDGLNGQGFEYHNPDAKHCGCGTSFS